MDRRSGTCRQARREAGERDDGAGIPRGPHGGADRLVLVKHAAPAIDPGLPAHRWPLSRKGEARCVPLAERLAAFRPVVLATSPEPKARRTADVVAARLGLAAAIVEGLREHDRSEVPYLGDGEFEAMVARFFAHPTDLVFGRETAEFALSRFSAAVDGVLDRHPSGTMVIVAHGTVIALFVAARVGAEAFPLWRRLGLPSFVVLSRPGSVVEEVVAEI